LKTTKDKRIKSEWDKELGAKLWKDPTMSIVKIAQLCGGKETAVRYYGYEHWGVRPKYQQPRQKPIEAQKPQPLAPGASTLPPLPSLQLPLPDIKMEN
jgi:hypothetical protein